MELNSTITLRYFVFDFPITYVPFISVHPLFYELLSYCFVPENWCIPVNVYEMKCVVCIVSNKIELCCMLHLFELNRFHFISFSWRYLSFIFFQDYSRSFLTTQWICQMLMWWLMSRVLLFVELMIWNQCDCCAGHGVCHWCDGCWWSVLIVMWMWMWMLMLICGCQWW